MFDGKQGGRFGSVVSREAGWLLGVLGASCLALCAAGVARATSASVYVANVGTHGAGGVSQYTVGGLGRLSPKTPATVTAGTGRLRSGPPRTVRTCMSPTPSLVGGNFAVQRRRRRAPVAEESRDRHRRRLAARDRGLARTARACTSQTSRRMVRVGSPNTPSAPAAVCPRRRPRLSPPVTSRSGSRSARTARARRCPTSTRMVRAGSRSTPPAPAGACLRTLLRPSTAATSPAP